MARQLTIVDLAADGMDGIQARTHDPLWLLARQWQLGELQGEDAGSPVGARMAVEVAPLVAWQPGARRTADAPLPYDPGRQPLEALVEAETWDTAAQGHLRLAVETGLRLQQLLERAGVARAVRVLRTSYALRPPPAGSPADPASRRWVEVVAGRVLDGGALFRRLRTTPGAPLATLPAEAPFTLLDAADRPAVLAQLDRWLAECEQLAPGGFTTLAAVGRAPAWSRERLEYAFAAGARLGGVAVTLTAAEHFEGEADWHAFTIDPARELAPAGAPASTPPPVTFLPTPLHFAGMPLPRFWELEDAHVNLPRLESARDDPVSRMFLDFALRYGNDWYTVPLQLPAGSLSRIQSLVVTTTFGERLLVQHASRSDVPAAGWSMFALSVVPSAPPPPAPPALRFGELFLLPAAPAQVLESAPVEEVRLVRDELANVAWAIEVRVESAAALPVDRVEQSRAAQRGGAPAPAPQGALPRYRLGVGAPEHWVPLLPVPLVPGAPRWLERAAAPRIEGDEIVGALPALGRVLEPGTALRVFDEEVPREGALVVRRYRYARAPDGSAHLWIGRRKLPGRGEASSGLRFDVIEGGS